MLPAYLGDNELQTRLDFVKYKLATQDIPEGPGHAHPPEKLWMEFLLQLTPRVEPNQRAAGKERANTACVVIWLSFL